MVGMILAGAVSAMLALWLRPLKPEYSIFLSLCAMLLLIGTAVSWLDPVLNLMQTLVEESGLESVYYKILLKIMGLAWISQLASDICLEAGCPSISRQIGICGKLVILSVSLPVVTTLVDTIETLFS